MLGAIVIFLEVSQSSNQARGSSGPSNSKSSRINEKRAINGLQLLNDQDAEGSFIIENFKHKEERVRTFCWGL